MPTSSQRKSPGRTRRKMILASAVIMLSAGGCSDSDDSDLRGVEPAAGGEATGTVTPDDDWKRPGELLAAPTQSPPTPDEEPTGSAGSEPDDEDDDAAESPGADDTPAEPVDLGGFPDEASVGVPGGVELTESESLVIDEDGAVVEGLHITGSLTVDADDVVVRNTRITSTGGIAVRSNGANLVIEDSVIDGAGLANPAVAYDNYTLRRVHIFDAQEGPRIAGGDVTIEDSLIHSLVQVGDNHTDVIQAVSGDNIIIRGNNLQAYNPDSGTYGNAAFQYGEEDGPVHDCLVEANLINGGNYSVNGGGGGTEGASCKFRKNVFQRDSRYGAAGNLGPGTDWDDSNIWFDTGLPVRGG